VDRKRRVVAGADRGGRAGTDGRPRAGPRIRRARSQSRRCRPGAGLGVTWGDGVLEYRGEKYPFTVRGFDIGGRRSREGDRQWDGLQSEERRRLLRNVRGRGSRAPRFGAGAGSGAMYNNNSVTMVWTGTNQGLNFTLAHSGVNVQLTQEAKLQAAKVRTAATARTARARSLGGQRWGISTFRTPSKAIALTMPAARAP